MKALYIHSASTFIGDAGTDTSRLKEELNRYGCGSFRRVNRFILITMIGSRMCINGHVPGANTAIYLTTDHGNLGDTVSVLDEIYAARSLPKPYNFINTMTNTAAFYLAQNLRTRGRNITVSSRHLSFERSRPSCNGYCGRANRQRLNRRRRRCLQFRSSHGKLRDRSMEKRGRKRMVLHTSRTRRHVRGFSGKPHISGQRILPEMDSGKEYIFCGHGCVRRFDQQGGKSPLGRGFKPR